MTKRARAVIFDRKPSYLICELCPETIWMSDFVRADSGWVQCGLSRKMFTRKKNFTVTAAWCPRHKNEIFSIENPTLRELSEIFEANRLNNVKQPEPTA
jgi:hypothetical protein